MIRLLVLLVVLAVGAIVYPRIAENTDDVCGALGKRLGVVMGGARPAGRTIDYAAVADAMLAARFPQVPATLRCTGAYWVTMIQPEMAKSMLGLVPAAK